MTTGAFAVYTIRYVKLTPGSPFTTSGDRSSNVTTGHLNVENNPKADLNKNLINGYTSLNCGNSKDYLTAKVATGIFWLNSAALLVL